MLIIIVYAKNEIEITHIICFFPFSEAKKGVATFCKKL